jgi:regulator of cell morphogenesis and NO signaling
MKSMKNNNVVNFNEMSIDKLVGYISSTHHSYLKEVIHSFSVHLKTMLKVDVKDHAEVISMRDEIVKLKALLEQHITMEEHILFPYINRLILKNEPLRKTEIISESLIRKIKKEHLTILMIINKIRVLSKGYTPPVNSSPTLKLCYAQMFDLEQDIYRHVFVEENILFPKLLDFEKRLTNYVTK